jgi:hypothetical protein
LWLVQEVGFDVPILAADLRLFLGVLAKIQKFSLEKEAEFCGLEASPAMPRRRQQLGSKKCDNCDGFSMMTEFQGAPTPFGEGWRLVYIP